MKYKVTECFEYRNGKLYWKKKPTPQSNVKIGCHAGYLHNTGYRRIKLDGKMYSEHQLVWCYFNGYIPKQIDHINRIRDDNRIENLREITSSQNQMNNKKRKATSSTNKGVSWYASRRRWRATIMKNKKQEYIGTYGTEEEAARAYDCKAIELFGEYANLNFPIGDYK